MKNEKIKNLIKITKNLLMLSMVALSVNSFAANKSVEDIYDQITEVQINKNEVETKEKKLIESTQKYFNDVVKKLKDENLIKLKAEPEADITIVDKNHKNMFEMRFEYYKKPIVNIVLNSNIEGREINFSSDEKVLENIKKNNLKLSTQDIFEFALFHELAHIQHYSLQNMFQLDQLTENDNNRFNYLLNLRSNGFFKLNNKTDDNIKTQYIENYADFLGSIWYLKTNNFSDESIKKLIDISKMRELVHEGHFHDKDEVDPYKTSDMINYVVKNQEMFKKMNGTEINEIALNAVGENSLKQLNELSAKYKQGSILYKNFVPLKNKIESFRNNSVEIIKNQNSK